MESWELLSHGRGHRFNPCTAHHHHFSPMTVRSRFAPSPTGLLHIGGVRTALFCWLYARRHGGRSSCASRTRTASAPPPEATQVILDGMQWLGLDHDEGPFYQTQRIRPVRAR